MTNTDEVPQQPERITEFVAQERAAIVVYEIAANGTEMTTAEIARRVGVTHDGALKIMNRISRVVPIYPRNGVWTRR